MATKPTSLNINTKTANRLNVTTDALRTDLNVLDNVAVNVHFESLPSNAPPNKSTISLSTNQASHLGITTDATAIDIATPDGATVNDTIKGATPLRQTHKGGVALSYCLSIGLLVVVGLFLGSLDELVASVQCFVNQHQPYGLV